MKQYQRNQWGSITVTLEELSLTDRLFLIVALVASLILTFPQVALASHESPFFFAARQEELNKYLTQQIKPWEDQKLEIAVVEAEDSFELILVPIDPDLLDDSDPRLEILREYLAQKKSPMANHVSSLLQKNNYRFIIAISFAESNFCKVNIRPHNCWGIGGSYPESYANYPAAFERADALIQKYHDQGMTTAKLMRNLWVGWKNDNWIIAVDGVLAELESLGL